MAEYIPSEVQIFFRMNLDIFLTLSFKTLSQSVTSHYNLYKTDLLQKDNSMVIPMPN